ncbi:MAG TPA: hydrogenase expression/formation protein HypE [Chloroflexi bacterium]|nr:hydrogenase expression/formation protein HypE [Chloroflexota bacterium]
MQSKPNFNSWVCPIPLKNYPTIVMGHGSGGKMMSDLIRHMFLPISNSQALAQMGDAAVLDMAGMGNPVGRFAFSTDSFVVSPLVFPGGDIGKLAVHGTINDLAMTGAKPLYLSAGFILEEGLPMDLLGQIATSFAAACSQAGVELVTGDTKVVNKGHGDGVYINTTGIGLIPEGVDIRPDRAEAGDVILVSGTVGDHGMAIMSVREGLEFESQIQSDSANLHDLVTIMLAETQDIHCLRDATRGGLAAALNELATSSQVGVEFEESRVPVQTSVAAACEMLGIDPFYVANEGKLVAILPATRAEAVLDKIRAHPLGAQAAIIGRVVQEHPGLVVAKTGIGARRVVDLPTGEILPRIC